MRKARRVSRNLAKAEKFVGLTRANHDHRRAVAAGMSVDALVSDVEPLPVAVEQVPQRIFGAVLLRVGVAGEFGE